MRVPEPAPPAAPPYAAGAGAGAGASVAAPDSQPAAGLGLRLHNLTLGYERHPAVHHLSLFCPAGSKLAIVGPNGAGKSTLLRALAGQLRPLTGRIDCLAGQRVAYLPQTPQIDRSFPVTVLDMVQYGLWHQSGALGRWSAAQRQRCLEALASVGLQGFERRTIDTLSGGQFQRALFARLILQDADLLLLDEPFAAVDEGTTLDLLQLLERWSAAGKTVLVVLHDLSLVRRHFAHTLLLAREPIAFGATAAVLTPANLRRAMNMREAFDEGAPWCEAEAEPAVHGHHVHEHAHEHAHGDSHRHEEHGSGHSAQPSRSQVQAAPARAAGVL
ncbi:ABC-type Mn/Zn transport systems, ATPase component [Serpentinimonas maccroryi]|uniref:ABC-type Mn/Zn transport systems, ATPase component n=1 Tax=Serpentinimonas maccroryi TaxID=1458426 RepID=A0A060NN41_9BURK|nr:ABC-type Mn/Zn transport systems, ATPase component [Serpentinimonas maccroryi]